MVQIPSAVLTRCPAMRPPGNDLERQYDKWINRTEVVSQLNLAMVIRSRYRAAVCSEAGAPLFPDNHRCRMASMDFLCPAGSSGGRTEITV